MKLTSLTDNIHQLSFKNPMAQVAVLSDIHWDNPHCDRTLLKKHLDYCKMYDIPVVIIGDLFCLMQGRGDPRRSKDDILPEHNGKDYLNLVIQDAVEWWGEYADLLTVVGYGNHETGIIKHQEVDMLSWFASAMRNEKGSKVQCGGYGGWVRLALKNKKQSAAFQMKYHHGSGGGGPVTRGSINLTRAMEQVEGMDIYAMGHIHESKAETVMRERLAHKGRGKFMVEHHKMHMMITGTYKDEYGDGSGGFHIEKGRPIKALGGRILELSIREITKDGNRSLHKHCDSKQFGI